MLRLVPESSSWSRKPNRPLKIHHIRIVELHVVMLQQRTPNVTQRLFKIESDDEGLASRRIRFEGPYTQLRSRNGEIDGLTGRGRE
jgi:hypothetical protein